MNYGDIFRARIDYLYKGPCWEGYEQYGMKMKDGKEVPNCVKKATDAQKKKIREVMSEWKKGKLSIGTSDKKVSDRKQAIAIALEQAGLSKSDYENDEELQKMCDEYKGKNLALEKSEELQAAYDCLFKSEEPKNGTIKRSTRKGKKAMVYMDGTWYHFGDDNYDHGYSKEAKQSFYERHAENLKGDDPRAKAFRAYAKKYW